MLAVMTVMLLEPDGNEHGSTSASGSAGLRLLDIDRRHHGAAANCGFHLTRSKWDPYPWVSAVDVGSAAGNAGVRRGDCVLEVNGEDVLGRRIGEIAEAVRANPDQVSLLLWNTGVHPQCKPESLCCGPMPSNMQRLSTCLSTILSCMECPICLDTISPPANQCINGHLICSKCHTKSERCPVCRIRLSRSRSLFADQVYNSVTDAFEFTKESDEKVRTAKINEIFRLRKKNKNNPEIKVTQSHTNRFLERFVEKSSSVENLSQQYLAPKTLLNEFNTSLRTKSLSTSEIFNPGVMSRTVFQNGSKSNLNSRILYGRSFESLDGNICINHSNSTSSTCQTDEPLYYCPFSIECIQRIKGNMITQHFQETHDGPFIQYFRCKMTFNLQIAHNHTYCIIHNTGKHFYLKIDMTDENNVNTTADCHGISIWMWFLGNQNEANEYHLQIHLYYSSCPEKQLLSLNSSIYSLSTTSWKNIKTMQKGIFLPNTTLNALNLRSNDIMDNISVTSINKQINKRTLNNKYRHASKYLGDRKNELSDCLNWEKHSHVPILRNGCSSDLASSEIDGKSISLRSTCSFDSIVHVTMVAALDFPDIRKKIASIKDDKFFNLITTLLEKGISRDTYNKRAIILYETIRNCNKIALFTEILHCDVTSPWLIKKLFEKMPSVVEKTTCTSCTNERFLSLTAKTLADSSIQSSYNFSQKLLETEEGFCSICQGTLVSKIDSVGLVVSFEIINDETYNNVTIKLDDIPKIIENPVDSQKKLFLVGVIEFLSSEHSRKRSFKDNESLKSLVGHNIAYGYRRGSNIWVKYDDLLRSPETTKSNIKIEPQILMYINSNKQP